MLELLCSILEKVTLFVKRLLSWNEDRAGPIILATIIVVAILAFIIVAIASP
jgi:hypothetical protein